MNRSANSSLPIFTASDLAALWSQSNHAIHFYHPHRLTGEPLLATLPQLGLEVLGRWGELIIVRGPSKSKPKPCYWAQNIWHDVQLVTINSVKDAAQKLKAQHHLWWPYALQHHRRMTLIQEQLFPKQSKRLPAPPNDMTKYSQTAAKVGCYSLLEPTLMVMSADCQETVPHGVYEFIENKDEPPNRAYLKLWEAFTRIGTAPKTGERCLELGASPGGWTWVLAQQLHAEVTAIDRSPLVPALMNLPNIHFVQGDAFDLSHTSAKVPLDWIFSDVICYPEKLFSYVQECLQQNMAKNYLCTIKFQGNNQYPWIEKFAKIPGSQIVHLYHNKHELTWIKLG